MAGELIPSDFTHGYYEFDGQVGGQILDLSGNGFDLTVVGATDVVTGKFNNGLEHDGTNDFTTGAQANYSDLTDQMGMFLWVKLLRTATAVDGIVLKGNSSSGGQDIFLYQDNDQAGHYRINNFGDSSIRTLGITDHRLIVLNYDGANAFMSMDNDALSGGTQGGNIRNTDKLYIGSLAGGGNNGKIIISQFGMRNDPFTTDEISFLWNSGAGRLLEVPTASNLMLMEV